MQHEYLTPDSVSITFPSVVRVDEIMGTLSQTEVRFSSIEAVPLLGKIQSLPRTGKAVRIDKYHLNVPKQSLLDHIRTLSVLADVFKSALNADVDSNLLAKMAAFHDLAEALTGDVPDFTDKGLAADNHMTVEEKISQEKVANSLIAESLSGSLKDDFVSTLECLDDHNLYETKFFIMLDKVEPIISVWRYLNQFRGQMDIEHFLEAMTDFFVNPKVIKTCLTQDVVRLVSFLQDKKMAKKYHEVGPTAHIFLQPNVFPPDILQTMFDLPIRCV
ncbi:HD domain-containing protein [Candidatus Uhrbacteria bacterium]|nr:HD domain-containing protein [Candidatus Uhrbacteria bacterium]